MKITETVALPPVGQQELVHPLDLPEARKEFRRAYITRALTSPGIALVIAALIWFLVENWVAPVTSFFSLAVIGYFAASWSEREAWAYIPRKRRDPNRELPFTWQFASSVLLAALLTVGVLLLGVRFADFRSEVREYVLGAGLAIVAMCVVVLIIGLARPARRRAALFTIPPIVGLATSIAIVYFWAFPGFVQSSTVLMGAGITAVIGALAGMWKLHDQRRGSASA